MIQITIPERILVQLTVGACIICSKVTKIECAAASRSAGKRPGALYDARRSTVDETTRAGTLPPNTSSQRLVRAIGRWSLTALVVNSVIGSGVFGLPSTVAGYLGRFSPWAVLLAGLGMAVIFGCFAEVSSQFHQAGGPYLYARTAFGRAMGIQVGWMLCLGQAAAPAANANLFVIYLGEFWPRATEPDPARRDSHDSDWGTRAD